MNLLMALGVWPGSGSAHAKHRGLGDTGHGPRMNPRGTPERGLGPSSLPIPSHTHTDTHARMCTPSYDSNALSWEPDVSGYAGKLGSPLLLKGEWPE